MNTQQNNEALNMEVLQPSALEALERASIDTQVATAHRFPRSLEQFKKRALSMATLDAETAESCIYNRPVGKKQVNGVWVQEFAEGASIRLAEIVSAAYGNIRVASRIIEQTDRYVKCEGVAHDLESNYAAKSETMESTVKRDGTPFTEGMRTVVAKACLSKAFRDAIFKVVPRALCKPILIEAKKVAAGQGKPIDERRKKVAAWLSFRKIDEKRVFAALGVKGWADITDEHLTTLTGIKTAIMDGDVDQNEAFPIIGKTAEPTAFQQSQGPSEPEKEQILKDAHKKEDEAAEAEAGLAPEQTKKPSPAPPEGEFLKRHGESDALTEVRFLLHKAGKTEDQLLKLCLDKRYSKDGQKLSDLSEKKLLDIAKGFEGLAGEMK